MAREEIRFDPDGMALVLGEYRCPVGTDGWVSLPIDAVKEASISSFEKALRAYEDHRGSMMDMAFLSSIPPEDFNPDTSPRELGLSFLEGQVTVLIVHHLEDDEPNVDMDQLLKPLVERWGGVIDGSYTDSNGLEEVEIHMLALVDHERSLGELSTFGLEADALVGGVAGTGSLTAGSVRDILGAGMTEAILGQPETSWIDAKTVPHRTDTDTAKFELAKDVAAFANTGEDAVIVYGIETEKGVEGDVLQTPHPFELSDFDIPAIQSVLNDRLTPVLTDVEVKAVETRAGYGYGWIFIPAQPTWIRPVLVRGALIGDRVGGSFFSLPTRAGEHTVHWDPSTVHSLIQAGRVALQRESPEEGPADD
jgi:hypothetical protein